MPAQYTLQAIPKVLKKLSAGLKDYYYITEKLCDFYAQHKCPFVTSVPRFSANVL